MKDTFEPSYRIMRHLSDMLYCQCLEMEVVVVFLPHSENLLTATIIPSFEVNETYEFNLAIFHRKNVMTRK